MLTTGDEMRQDNGEQALGMAILIGSGRPCDAITDILCVQGLETTTFGGVEEVPSRAEHDDPLLIVLWAETPSSSLARSVGLLAQRFEGVPVIVVCADIQRWGVRTALAAGAAGIVLYDEVDSTLGPCMQAVLTGQTCVPQAHWREIEPPALSTREKQILGLVVMGYMNSQIAEQLFVAESTVKSHLSSAFGKLGVRSRNEAVDLILDSERGLGMGILSLGGDSVEAIPTTAQ
jgi:DNA-binding NarL/FixJ family response regulator